MKFKEKTDLVSVITEIEIEVQKLLEENSRLQSQVSDLSKRNADPQDDATGRIAYLEDEVKKLRRIIDDLRNQEMTNRDRIFQVRKLFQEEIDKKYQGGKSASNYKTQDGEESPLDFDTGKTNEEGGAEIGYNPYIGVDEEDIPTHHPVVGGMDEENFSPVSLEAEKPAPPSTQDSKKEEKPEPSHDLKNIPEKHPQTPVKESSNTFLINDFTKEEDPFGDEDSKMEDEDFFKSSSQTE